MHFAQNVMTRLLSGPSWAGALGSHVVYCNLTMFYA
jgi:hypothetical protein